MGGWTWAKGSPKERADAVRSHGKLKLRFRDLCYLFNLTADGAWEILKGDIWRPEYDMDVERGRRLNLIRHIIKLREDR
jgi:hypothetical protein